MPRRKEKKSRKFLWILCASLLVGSAGAQTPKSTQPDSKRMQHVYVDGENRAARLTRDLLSIRTCFQLAIDEAKADGVLTIDQREGTWSDGSRYVGVLGFLRDKRGKQIWRARQFIQEDELGQGTVMAVGGLLKNLNTSACGKAH